MGLIADRRPRDWAYKAAFDRKDLPSLEAMARHIRETHDVKMIEDFNTKCEQKLRGEPATLDNGLEIKAVTKTEDLVVNGGLQQCINIILGTSSARWSHFGNSTGNIPPTVSDTALEAETVTTRVALAWNESAGMRLYFGGISSQTGSLTTGAVAPFAPNTIQEMGVFNSASAGATLLNRSVFTADDISQDSTTVSQLLTAPLVMSCVIAFCPVA